VDKSLLVEIFVPTTDAAGTDHQGRSGSLATGFPVGPHHILTARHVLFPEPPVVRDPRHPIKVRWHYHRIHPQADQLGWISLGPDAEAILWPEGEALLKAPGEGELDALLLDAMPPRSARGWRELSPEPPYTNLAWESEGFPLATKYDDRREPCSFKGTCFAKAEAEAYFELEADAPPRQEEDWRGASGMPLFAGRRIVGIARRVPRRFGGERLHATPAWKLLQDPAFCLALGLDERRDQVAKVHAAICRELDPGSIAALAAEFGVENELVGKVDGEKAAALADRLLRSDVRDAIKLLRKAQQRAEDRGGGDAAAALLRTATVIIPALFDRGVVRQVEALAASALVPLPAGTLTVAELVMAAGDGRRARLRPREAEDHQPAGELNLPLYPEQGIATDASKALAGHMQRKLNPGEAAVQQLRTAVDEYLLGTFYRPDPYEPDFERAQRVQLVADTLRRRRTDTGETYYLVFRPPRDPSERAPFEAMVETLKRDFDAIAILELDLRFEQVRADRDLADPLCRMLPLEPKRSEADA
jgi:hypothetical protein